ncbi:antigen WC1.1-like isoform X2 [Oreochromis aureus]|uniref:SRCR domain-containing protein n=1 Tax=Oreochromis aureus TaxID=47969 RepID=A0AAZ1WYY5_OREAU|nr:antigen WC1.1-like isoform X2 [Oreochromis aureus]
MDHLLVLLLLWSSGVQAEEKHNSESDDVRLVGGASHCAGTLELKHLGEWRIVSGYARTLKHAAIVCQLLDCGSAVSVEWRIETPNTPVWKMKIECIQSGSAVRDCVTSDSSRVITSVTCADSVRLLNGSSLCSGRLEVKSNQSWSSVCEADFDQQDAEVVCKELGCGPPLALQGALYGEVEAPVWSKEFQCGGHESALLDCRSSGSARNSCSPGKAVGLTCSESDDVRLVGGASRCAGILELKHLGEWRPMYESGWTLKDAAPICEHLDCGSAVSLQETKPLKFGWRIKPDCVQSRSTLRECTASGYYNPIMNLTCSDSVRLLNGSSLCSGRLEVKSNQSWSSVCEADFDQQDAEVVCRELGCGPPSVLQGALYGEVEAPVWSKEFQCGGHESALLDCRSSGSARNSCSPGKAVGLTCSESDDVRLVGGTNYCEGMMELRHLGEWRTVSAFSWTLKDAAVVCKHLDCGSAVSVNSRLALLNRPAWWIKYDCVHVRSALKDCTASSSHDFILNITCSESVRLGGASRCAGTVELKHQGEWRPAIDYDLRKAAVVCEYLDCGSAVSAVIRPKSSPADVLEISSDCFQSGSTRSECAAPNASNYTLDLICSDLLVQPNIHASSMDGVSESQEQGLTVSRRSNFTIRCSIQPQYPGGSFQLTFNSTNTTYSYTQPAVNHSAHFLFPAAEPAHQGNYSCVYHVYVFSHNFSSESRLLPVTVSEFVSLVGGPSRCAGTLELKHLGVWRPMDGSDWTIKAASVICEHLDCGSAVSVEWREDSTEKSVWKIQNNCIESGSAIKECLQLWLSSFSLYLTCSDSVRLLNGSSLCSGRLQVKSNQSWSSVCEADFDQQDAEVVCRELGCGPPSVLQGALYGEVEAPVWSKEFQCGGHESALLDCRSSGSARNSCSPGKAVGLTCSEPDDVRLVGGASRCAGSLELKLGEWRPVEASEWILGKAAVICEHLHCGSLDYVEARNESLLRSVWRLKPDCVQSGSALRECATSEYSLMIMNFTCSDLLIQPNIHAFSMDGVSEAQQQGLQVSSRSNFTISCSIQPQYPGGSFQLTFTSSNTTYSYTQPAVNHSAHFLFPAAEPAHQGNYSCVYHIYVFSHNFSSESRLLSVAVSASTVHTITGVVLLLILLIVITALYFSWKASREQKLR